MGRNARSSASPRKRRITLSLPAECLDQAKRIARSRKVDLSVVVSEALAKARVPRRPPSEAKKVMKAYKKAFSGFSEKEMCILDGIILEGENQR